VISENKVKAKPLKVLDLFAGLGGWGQPFRDAGHDVVTLDFDPRFNTDHVRDILTVESLAELERDGRFDVVLASPPCETFSVASIGRYWTGGKRGYEPKNDRARVGLSIMFKTFALVDAYAPRYFVIENPRGMMRKLAPRGPQATTWYCQWGMPYAKPTDVWTNLAGVWPSCRNGSTDHEAARRGAKTGVQGIFGESERVRLERGEKVLGYGLRPNGSLRRFTAFEMKTGGVTGAAKRALIPYEMADAVRRACETDGTIRGPKLEQLALAVG